MVARGTTKEKKMCPAINKKCNACGKMGHFARVCMSAQHYNSRNQQRNNNKQTQQRDNRRVNFNNTEEQNRDCCDSESSYNISAVKTSSIPKVTLSLNNTLVPFIIDTGSSVNLISTKIYQQLPLVNLEKVSTVILPYNSTKQLEVVGKFQGKFQFNNKLVEEEVFVINGKGEALLSYGTSLKLKLVNLTLANTQTIDENFVKQNFPQICSGVGNLNTTTVKLHIDKTVQPTANKHRRVPLHLRKQVEDELMRLQKEDIIEKATGPTPWVSPIVIVPKPRNPNTFRLCVDMRKANRAIKRERHPMPTIDEIFAELNGAKFFSKIDLKEGYHQLTLDEKSRYITVFSTHVGLFRYKRLSFGINSASEIFQDSIRQVLSNIPGVINVSDDILIYGKAVPEHNQALLRVLERLKQCNLTLNPNKCVFSVNKIHFYGHIFADDGIYPDPIKVKAITDLDPPSNIKELRSFLGMLNYIGRFLPDISNTTVTLRQLLHKDAIWTWSDAQEGAFKRIKEILKDVHKLAYFDTKKNTHLHVDAGPTGLGAILSQEQGDKTEIITYASRTLTETEQKYSQIEKELLAVVWAIQHFNIYLLGNKFTLHTDHKPLISILSNPHASPSARIERLCLKIQQYKFRIVHQNGQSNPADYLSRHPLNDKKSVNPSPAVEEYASFILRCATPHALSMETILEETNQDSVLQKLRQAVKEDNYNFWQQDELKPYKHIQHEISDVNGILLRQHRIILPESLRLKAVELAHIGHLGVVKTKQLIRTKLWFPNLDKLVEEFIKGCVPCQVNTPTNYRNAVYTTPSATHPFDVVDVDYAGPFPDGKYAFLLVDEYTRFPFVKFVSSTSFKNLQTVLNNIFSTFGFPNKLKSDNGPPFNGTDFKSHLKNCDIVHHPITPYWPEANGMVERFVKTIKKHICCLNFEQNDYRQNIHNFLMNYRDTPHQTTGKSPYALMFDRKVRTFLPHIPEAYRNTTNYDSKIDRQNRLKQNERANEKRNLRVPMFNIGDIVLCKQQKKNALTPYFDPKPYKIVRITGSQIEAEREDKKIVRNSSFFKPFKLPKTPVITPQKYPSNSSLAGDSNQQRRSPTLNPPRVTATKKPHAVTPPTSPGREVVSRETFRRSPSAQGHVSLPGDLEDELPAISGTSPSAPTSTATPSSRESDRPTRQRRPPARLNDFVML